MQYTYSHTKKLRDVLLTLPIIIILQHWEDTVQLYTVHWINSIFLTYTFQRGYSLKTHILES